MKVIFLAVLLGTALMLTGCTDSQRQMITQVTEPEYAIQPGEPEDAAIVGQVVTATDGDEWVPAEIDYDTREAFKAESCSTETEGDPWAGFRVWAPHLTWHSPPCEHKRLVPGDRSYVLIEFDNMEEHPETSRTVGIQFHYDEVDILNAQDFFEDIDNDEPGTITALYEMDDTDTVVVHFEYLGTTREFIRRNSLFPDEIEIGIRIGQVGYRPGSAIDSHIRIGVDRGENRRWW